MFDSEKTQNAGHQALCEALRDERALTTDALKLLLPKDGSFDINAQNKDGATPLSLAIENNRSINQLALVKCLLEAGANPLKKACLCSLSDYSKLPEDVILATVSFGCGDFYTDVALGPVVKLSRHHNKGSQ